MKKRLLKFLTLALFFGTLLFPALSFGAVTSSGSGDNKLCYTVISTGAQSCLFFPSASQCTSTQTSLQAGGLVNITSTCQNSPGGNASFTASSPGDTPSQNDEKLGLNCAGWTGIHFADCVALTGYYVFYVPAQWLLVLAGYVFNAFMAISLSSKLLGSPFVLEIWRTILNLSDIVFIFLLLYIAVRTVLGLGHWKEEVGKVIVVALLINFSLFFTQVVVDASNLTAFAFYNRISTQEATIGSKNGWGLGVQALIPESSIGFKARAVSEYFGEAVHPNTISGIPNAHDWAESNNNGGVAVLFFVFLVTAIVVGALAYAFFEAAFLMLGRVISFWFLMIFSPFAFIGFVLPKASKITGAWTERVTNQALLAPVFLMFLYIIAFALKSSIFVVGNISNTTIVGLLLSLILKTALVVGMILLAVKTAKGMSDEFGNSMRDTLGKYVMGAAKGAAGMAGGAALGLNAKLARATVGRLAQRAADSDTLKDKASQKGLSGWMARQQLKAARGIGASSMDIRSTHLGKMATKATGIDLGKAQSGGFKAERDEQRKKDLEFAQSLEVDKDSKLGREQQATKAAKITTENDRKQAESSHGEAKKELDKAEEELNRGGFTTSQARQVVIDRTMAAQERFDSTKTILDDATKAAKAAEEAAAAINKAVEGENRFRRKGYAETLESRGSGIGYALNIAINPSYSGRTAQETASEIRSGSKAGYKSKGDAAKDSEKIVTTNEQIITSLGELASAIKGMGPRNP